MSVEKIIKEALNTNPIGLKEAFEEELRARIALALEEARKCKNEEDECDDEEDDDEEDEEDDEDLDEAIDDLLELDDKTLASYTKKASADFSKRKSEIEAGKPGNLKKAQLRRQGVNRALDKMTQRRFS